jgi:hypothetical protein
MVKIITLIPLTYNDGQRIPIHVYREFENEILQITGGFSIDGITAGAWMDNNELFRDRSKKYIIAAREDQVEEVKQVVVRMGKRLQQRAMYFETIHEGTIEFIEID